MGYSGIFPLRLTDDGYVWEVPAGPGAIIRYTAVIQRRQLARDRRAHRRRRAAGPDLRDATSAGSAPRAGRPPIRCRCADGANGDSRTVVTVPQAVPAVMVRPARLRATGRGANREATHGQGRERACRSRRLHGGRRSGAIRARPSSSRRCRRSPRTFSTSSPTRRNITAGRSCAASPSPTGSSRFRVCWEDDNHNIRVQRGYRVQNNNAIGPYKGGIRFHPSVNELDPQVPRLRADLQERADRPADGRRQGRRQLQSQGQERRRDHALLPELHDRALPPYRRRRRRAGRRHRRRRRARSATCSASTSASPTSSTGVLTGKGLEYGGSLIRTEATGYGAVYFLENMLKTQGHDLAGKTRRHLGLGQRRHPCRREDRPARRQGADPVGQRGLRPRSRRHHPGEDRLGEGAQDPAPRPDQRICRRVSRARPSTPASAPGASPCDVALPCATQNELLGEDARTLVAERLHRGRRRRQHADRPRRRARLQGREIALRARQGRQCRRRRRLGPRDEPELERRISWKEERAAAAAAGHHGRHPRRAASNMATAAAAMSTM